MLLSAASIYIAHKVKESSPKLTTLKYGLGFLGAAIASSSTRHSCPTAVVTTITYGLISAVSLASFVISYFYNEPACPEFSSCATSKLQDLERTVRALRKLLMEARINAQDDAAFFAQPRDYSSATIKERTPRTGKRRERRGKKRGSKSAHNGQKQSSEFASNEVTTSQNKPLGHNPSESQIDAPHISITRRTMARRANRPTPAKPIDVHGSGVHDRIALRLEPYQVTREIAHELVTTYGAKRIQVGLERLQDILENGALSKLLEEEPHILAREEQYYSTLAMAVSMLKPRTSRVSRSGRLESFYGIEDYLQRLTTIDSLGELVKELDVQKATSSEIEDIAQLMQSEGYDPGLLHALLTQGLELLTSHARIGEAYINERDYWNNARKAIPHEKVQAAKKLFKVLRAEGMITSKKSDRVYRLNPHWRELDNDTLVGYVNVVMQERRNVIR